jgi:hypothetical protein
MLDVRERLGGSAGEDGSSHFNLIFLPLGFLGYDVFEGGEPLPLLSDGNESNPNWAISSLFKGDEFISYIPSYIL